MKNKHIKWVIAHEPIELFLMVAEHFTAEVNEKLGADSLEIEVLSLSDYAEKYNNGKKISRKNLINMVNSGEIEMSHIYTNWLGGLNADMYALDLPYLFRDHEHADAVLEGTIGADLLAGVAANSNIQPMAFTYSGGFRVVPANFSAAEVTDWKGRIMRTSLSPVSDAVFKELGSNTTDKFEIEEMAAAALDGQIEAGESTYVRVLPLKQNEAFKYVNDTAHSLLLTSIIVNKDFMAQFDTDTQKIMSDAAFNAARIERRKSVADVPGIVAELHAQGVEIVNLSDEQKDAIKLATAPVYNMFDKTFTPGLVDAMRKAKK